MAGHGNDRMMADFAGDMSGEDTGGESQFDGLTLSTKETKI
jgi:hypothetical protein